MDFRSSWKRKQ